MYNGLVGPNSMGTCSTMVMYSYWSMGRLSTACSRTSKRRVANLSKRPHALVLDIRSE